MTRLRALLIIGSVLGLAGYQASTISQSLHAVTTPHQAFGANIGDDYFLATYRQLEQYWKTLDAESDRVRLVSIGRSEEGREQWMAIVSAPENLADLDRYRALSRRLANGDASEQEAAQLAREGKAIVWIDGGLHADEVLGAQQLIELVYQLADGDDPETLRYLRDVIVLVVHANPDGHALVADWYMRERDPMRRRLEGVPRPYQKYIGHDNNRDFFLSSQAETTNMNRALYREWFPQIVFDHHQSAPAGTIMFAPPFRGPFSQFVDPLIPESLDLVGAAMQARFANEGKRGVTMRDGGPYSTWWNGGLRTSAYFHNQIGLLAETTGHPTPTDLAVAPDRQVATVDLPMPIAPQRWRFRQSVEYSMTANRAVLDFASRHRETLLLNAYTMARRAITEGSSDAWIATPELRDGSGQSRRRAPRGYVLPSTQADFPTAARFVDALIKSGVAVLRASDTFHVNGTTYAPGSFVIKTAQPFRAHVLDMFEPQQYPGDETPYDIAGWTLAWQMGVTFDRVLDAFDGPFERVETVSLPRASIAGSGSAGYLISPRQNNSAIVVNRLLRDGVPVYRVPVNPDATKSGEPDTTKTGRALRRDDAAAIYVEDSNARDLLSRAARDLGVTVTAIAEAVTGARARVQARRIGLWDRYGGAASSGWMRWILERYEFPFEVVYSQRIDAGDLSSTYDVLILPDEAELQRVDTYSAGAPSEYGDRTGVLTLQRSVPALRRFVEEGGTVVLIGQAASLSPLLGAEVERWPPRVEAEGPFSIPGSILRLQVDPTLPVAFGYEPEVDVFFDNGPVFRVTGPSVTTVARYATAPLRSGWGRGADQIAGLAAAFDAPVGRGRVIAFGPHIAFRAQSQATFRFLFNAINYPVSD